MMTQCVIVLFIPFNIFISKNYALAGLEGGMFLLIAGINIMLMPNKRGYEQATWIYPTLAGIWSVYIGIFGNLFNYALSWSLLFISMLFFFLGKKRGAQASFIYLLWLAIYLATQVDDRISWAGYSNFFASGVFLFAILSFYEDYKAKTEIMLRKMHITDDLTSLNNRRSINDLLDREISLAKRHGRPLGIILLDIDYFKRINDVYGHPMGDKVLVAISRTLQNNVRTTDHVGRWGGEEFLIIAPETDLEHSVSLAEKLRHAICHTVLETGNVCTASFGVASYREDDTKELLIARADKRLYQAKYKGRNCVVCEP
ncbi:MAG TPA: GGDEF domain-containing protein [Pseudomonadales bacterium]|nr:GGDEF domain-containing protein [Pseudomonadales bacterium]